MSLYCLQQSIYNLANVMLYWQAKVFDFDETTPSSTVSNKKNIKATNSVIGFLGLGVMGVGMVKNLVKHGHKVCVWNKTSSKVSYFDMLSSATCRTPVIRNTSYSMEVVCTMTCDIRSCLHHEVQHSSYLYGKIRLFQHFTFHVGMND